MKPHMTCTHQYSLQLQPMGMKKACDLFSCTSTFHQGGKPCNPSWIPRASVLLESSASLLRELTALIINSSHHATAHPSPRASYQSHPDDPKPLSR